MTTHKIKLGLTIASFVFYVLGIAGCLYFYDWKLAAIILIFLYAHNIERRIKDMKQL